mmetsp:Transcript_68963/g.128787  ORF Transcript_68963/g.128787 Transcript_68963/m.128787 type:complete len:218 (+) Transcript_68963:51-704(+)
MRAVLRICIWAAFHAVQVPAGPMHVILDAEADIRDLDVGDLSDMESDVPKHFLDELKKRSQSPPDLSSMMHSKDPSQMFAAAQGGTQMTFATLTMNKAEELGKEGTDKLASQWKGMLETGGVSAQCYSIDPGKVLFVTDGPGLVDKVKDFVLQQPDVDWFEFQQKRHFPNGRTKPLLDSEERDRREIELGWTKPPPDPAKPKPAQKASRKGSKKPSV